ncbi:MAG: hypothetical protein OXE84_03885 [Rhodobacteraceae bacterium]|nr:hypothetical protein [Paracoccaceae bacterium]MCY4196964.1 hypothetical protein [Paracoccaceae bacterium]
MPRPAVEFLNDLGGGGDLRWDLPNVQNIRCPKPHDTLERIGLSLDDAKALLGLLKDVLPVGTTRNAATVRNPLRRVANRMEAKTLSVAGDDRPTHELSDQQLGDLMAWTD